MRRSIFGMALVLFAAAARAEDVSDQPILVLQSGGHTAPISQILFTPDGKEVLTVAADKTIRRWDAASGERLGVYYLPAGPGDQAHRRRPPWHPTERRWPSSAAPTRWTVNVSAAYISWAWPTGASRPRCQAQVPARCPAWPFRTTARR